jgi:hypothetical protein
MEAIFEAYAYVEESSWGKERPARKADNLTAIYKPNF